MNSVIIGTEFREELESEVRATRRCLEANSLCPASSSVSGTMLRVEELNGLASPAPAMRIVPETGDDALGLRFEMSI